MENCLRENTESGDTMSLSPAFDRLPTCHAPAEIGSPVELERQRRYLNGLPHFQDILNAVSNPVLVVNETRQIVFCNRKLLELLGGVDVPKLIGLRPGEALGCARAGEGPGGCGTSEFCKTCGAVNAILIASEGIANEQECTLTRSNAGVVESVEFSIQATPLDLEMDGLVMLSLTDISHEKRRRNLERIFFHDILNAMNGVVGFASLIQESSPEEFPDFMDGLSSSIDRVLAEINVQRELLAAENKELRACLRLIGTLDFLRTVVSLYSVQEVARDRKIVVSPASENISMETDPTILGRVIGNMVKNGLEACRPGEAVILSCEMVGGKVRLSVRSPAFMPREVQLRVFTRTFSTKGCGRGLGTYSMKLLSERFLKGSVGFESNPDSGTEFYAEYPLRLSERG